MIDLLISWGKIFNLVINKVILIKKEFAISFFQLSL